MMDEEFVRGYGDKDTDVIDESQELRCKMLCQELYSCQTQIADGIRVPNNMQLPLGEPEFRFTCGSKAW